MERSCACGLNHGRLPGCAEMLQHFLEGRIQKRRCLFAPLIAAKLFTGKSRVNKSKPNQRTRGQSEESQGFLYTTAFIQFQSKHWRINCSRAILMPEELYFGIWNYNSNSQRPESEQVSSLSGAINTEIIFPFKILG